MSENHGGAYETQDFSFNRAIWIIPVSMVSLVIYVGICWFGATAALTHEMARKQAQGAEPMMKPLHQFRAHEDSGMHSYRWKDKDKGMVQIPIERAMEILSKG